MSEYKRLTKIDGEMCYGGNSPQQTLRKLVELEDAIESGELQFVNDWRMQLHNMYEQGKYDKALEMAQTKFQLGDFVYYLKRLPNKTYEIHQKQITQIYLGKTCVSYGLNIGEYGSVRKVRAENLYADKAQAEAKLKELLEGKK